MVKISIKPSKLIKSTSNATKATKQKWGQISNKKASMHSKKNRTWVFYVSFWKILVSNSHIFYVQQKIEDKLYYSCSVYKDYKVV